MSDSTTDSGMPGGTASGTPETAARPRRSDRDLLIFGWIFALVSIGGFCLAIGLMLFPPSFDNDGAADPESCGVPALYDPLAFSRKTYGSPDDLGELRVAGCTAAVETREHNAVGALAIAAPAGLISLTLHLQRRTASGD